MIIGRALDDFECPCKAVIKFNPLPVMPILGFSNSAANKDTM